jgi:hypothetical protein
MNGDEKWLPVPDYPGYEVSNHGQVRSLDREVGSRWGTPKRLKGRILSQARVGGGGPVGRYDACVLFRDKKRKSLTVHTLVLSAFVGPRPEGMWGLHRDDDPRNNRLENLYWGTPTQNTRDAVSSGRHRSIVQAAKTHCPQWHEYTEGNTYIRPNGSRECRTCHRDQVNRSNRSKQHSDT